MDQHRSVPVEPLSYGPDLDARAEPGLRDWLAVFAIVAVVLGVMAWVGASVVLAASCGGG